LWHVAETPAVSQKAAAPAPVPEPEPAVVEDEASATQCQDNFYWITTLPSGERTATGCCDQTDVNVDNATVCIMTDPMSSQVSSLIHRNSYNMKHKCFTYVQQEAQLLL